MEQQNDNLRASLLTRLPQPANYAAYQEKVAAGIAKNEKRLRRTWWATLALWFYVIAFFLLMTMYRGESWLATPHGHLAEMVWLFFAIYAAVEVLKLFISRSRVELLKEIKQLQLQVLALQAKLDGTDC